MAFVLTPQISVAAIHTTPLAPDIQSSSSPLSMGRPSWTKLSLNSSPPGVSGAMMAYDSVDGYIVLFGGANGTNCTNQTWKYLGGAWTQLHPRISPPARCDGAMAYDSGDKYVVLVGGIAWWGYLDDTWEFAGGQWTNVTASSTASANPGGLAYASMTYDASSRHILFFGGETDLGCGCVIQIWTIVYAFAKGVWTLKNSSVSPAKARSLLPGDGASIAYDSKDGYVVEFGGWNHGSVNATTWSYTHSRWTKLNPSTSPSWRYQDGLVFDSKLGYLVVFGGPGLNGTKDSNATWKFIGGSWLQLHPSQSPPAQNAPAVAAYDAADGYLLLFGGQNAGTSSPSNDSWVFR